MKFLLDTNAIAEPLRPHPNEQFLRQFRAHDGSFAVASTTWHEALYGMERMTDGRRKHAVAEFLRDVVIGTMRILPYDAAAAEWHARQRAKLGNRGRTVPFADGQIAAVAATNRLSLVTANGRDFEGFEGLRVMDWWA